MCSAFNVALAPFGVPGVIEPGVTVGYVLAEDQDLALKASRKPSMRARRMRAAGARRCGAQNVADGPSTGR